MNRPSQTLPSAPAYRRAPQEKRARLLAAAQKLFAEQGFDATTTLQIAQQAGVSEGILFHHFGSKKGLFVELAQAFAQGAADATMPPDATGVTEAFVVRSAFDFADANPALYDMLRKGSGELSAHDISEQSQILVRTIEHNLREGQKRGDVRDGDATVMAELQLAVVDGAYKAWRACGAPRVRKAKRETYIQEAIRCMQAMMAPTTTPETRGKTQ